jgi:hypothetical protein
VFVAYQGIRFIVVWLPQQSFPNEADFHIHVPVLLFSVGLGVLTGVVFGIIPALQLSRPGISQLMQSSTRKMAGNMRGKRLHSVLIGGQIALTLLLLTAAGVAIEGFVRMMHVNLGYNPHNVMSVGIPVHENTFSTWLSDRIISPNFGIVSRRFRVSSQLRFQPTPPLPTAVGANSLS